MNPVSNHIMSPPIPRHLTSLDACLVSHHTNMWLLIMRVDVKTAVEKQEPLCIYLTDPKLGSTITFSLKLDACLIFLS